MNYTVKQCDLKLDRMEKSENLRHSGNKNTSKFGEHIYGKQDIYVEAVYDINHF